MAEVMIINIGENSEGRGAWHQLTNHHFTLLRRSAMGEGGRGES
jgi:hypothetical protein